MLVVNETRSSDRKRAGSVRLTVESLDTMKLAWALGALALLGVASVIATAESGVEVFDMNSMSDGENGWSHVATLSPDATDQKYHFPHDDMARSHQFIYYTMEYKFNDTETWEGGPMPSTFSYSAQFGLEVSACNDDCGYSSNVAWGSLPNENGGWKWLERDTVFSVSDVKCKHHGHHCELMPVWHTNELEYSHYHVVVQLSYPHNLPEALDGETLDVRIKGNFHFISKGYSALQLAVSGVCLAVTLVVAAAYVRGLQAKPEPSFVQQWVAVLLAAAVCVNDPLLFLVIYDSNAIFDELHIWLLALGISAVLFFVPCLIDELRRGVAHGDAAAAEGDVERASRVGARAALALRRGAAYYGVKLLLVVPFCIITAQTYLLVRTQDTVPKYHTFVSDGSAANTETEAAHASAIALAALAAAYAIYIFSLLATLARASITVGLTPPPAAFALLLAAVAVACAIIGFAVSGALYPWPAEAWQFTLVYACVNFFVWCVALLYSPPALACCGGGVPGDDEDAEYTQAATGGTVGAQEHDGVFL